MYTKVWCSYFHHVNLFDLKKFSSFIMWGWWGRNQQDIIARKGKLLLNMKMWFSSSSSRYTYNMLIILTSIFNVVYTINYKLFTNFVYACKKCCKWFESFLVSTLQIITCLLLFPHQMKEKGIWVVQWDADSPVRFFFWPKLCFWFLTTWVRSGI